MRSKTNFRVSFFLKKTKLLKSGEASVSMRITVDGQRVENNIRKSILPNLWDQSKERTKGTSKTAIDLNRFIEEARINIHQIITELQQNGEEITPVVVQQRFYGIGQVRKQERTILQVIQEHNEEAEKLIGKDFVKITVRRYESMKRYLCEMIATPDTCGKGHAVCCRGGRGTFLWGLPQTVSMKHRQPQTMWRSPLS